MSTKAHKRTAIQALRQPKESNEKLISRFQKKVQQSRILTLAKEKLVFKKPLRKREIRARAIMREHYRSLREKQKYL